MESNQITKGNRVIIITISLAIVSIFLFLGLRNNTISENNLRSIQVILSYPPTYHSYKIKTTTYNEIDIQTKEYHKIFKISSFTYNATNHEALVSSLNAGDSIYLKVRSSDFTNLNVENKWRNYNEVFGVVKKEMSFINLALRNQLAKKDSRWAYLIVILGLVILPYGLIKTKPIIDLPYALIGTALIEIIVLFIFLKK